MRSGKQFMNKMRSSIRIQKPQKRSKQILEYKLNKLKNSTESFNSRLAKQKESANSKTSDLKLATQRNKKKKREENQYETPSGELTFASRPRKRRTNKTPNKQKEIIEITAEINGTET